MSTLKVQIEKMSGKGTRTSQQFGLGATGIWLVLLYFATIVPVLLTLSAHQLQHDIRGVEKTSGPISVWRILELREQWNDATSRLAEAVDLWERMLIEQQAANEQFQKKRIEYADIWNDFQEVRAPFVAHLQLELPGSNFDPSGTVNDERVRFAQMVESLGEPSDKLRMLSTEYEKRAIALERFKVEEEALNVRLQTVDNKLKIARNTMENAEKQRAEVLERASDNEDLRYKLGDFLNHFNYLENVSFGWSFSFAKMPGGMLTLIVVLAMGALGGTIHLTGVFFDPDDDRSFSYFLFRPFLGAVSALAIFILAKAGVLIISDTGASANSGATLSPFFVSFLGIVSGLLAEQAINTIQETGKNWFRVKEDLGSPRWAVKLNDELVSQQKSTDKLAARLSLSVEDVQAWVDEVKEVPIASQEVIAAWLDKPARELFTDIPPSKAHTV